MPFTSVHPGGGAQVCVRSSFSDCLQMGPWFKAFGAARETSLNHCAKSEFAYFLPSKPASCFGWDAFRSALPPTPLFLPFGGGGGSGGSSGNCDDGGAGGGNDDAGGGGDGGDGGGSRGDVGYGGRGDDAGSSGAGIGCWRKSGGAVGRWRKSGDAVGWRRKTGGCDVA